jgi:hypothetical protein
LHNWHIYVRGRNFLLICRIHCVFFIIYVKNVAKQNISFWAKTDFSFAPNTSNIYGGQLSWSHGSWIYNYLCNQYLSPLTYQSINPLPVWCKWMVKIRVMGFSATFNISIISWLSRLLVGETWVPGENHRPADHRPAA